jgi:DNA-binding NarL/FixJ family response regulator
MITPTEKTGVLLVEHHELLRAGLRALLEGDTSVEVLGETHSSDEAIELAQQLHPDIVLIDLRAPGIDAVEATRRIRSLARPPRVLALAMDPEEEVLLELVEAGGSGYLRKSAVEAKLLPAVHMIARGGLFFNQELIGLLRARRAAAQQLH